MFQILGSRDEVKAQMDRHQQESLQQVVEQTMMSKDIVIQRLLQLVCNVKPELHVNYSAEISADQ